MASNTQNPDERPLFFMEKLSPDVSIYRPSAAPDSEPLSDGNSSTYPKLIIIASWTNAKDVHVAKYVVKYRALYPAAQILLIKSTTKLLMDPPLIAKVVEPAIPVVRACLATGSPLPSSHSTPGLLIHIFSNGGSSSIANLYDKYAASASEGEDATLPRHITIFDSCPCIYRIEGSVVFLNSGLSFAQRILAAPLIYLVSFYWSVVIVLGIRPDWLAVWGRTHNDAKRKLEVRRTYIYSETDTLVGYKDIETHANAATSHGFEVRMETFEGSAHVSHARKDENRYWAVVRDTWENGNA
ncbi:hypothetical protein V1525DRAFT_459583 [Lipomyces kononenkoae]|uniref:Uncharacterized protein n=1 Tax=Lipomyces kononenkoae TaxID=34357 RepID=A0ACC3SRH3_LIPKO